MATTTNFGWETPDDTDLVKDGAAAIRTALGGVDTSFVDLKGGTTGQVLSKASNTDLDYTWVTTDDANAIQNAIVDAKGDLIAATAADTPARLAVGTNGQVLTADSSAATGLAWATPSGGSSYVAGKNFVINGAMDIWQRGTSGLGTSTGAYTADRWVLGSSSTTVTRDTDVPTSPYFQYSLKMVGTGDNSIIQRVEASNSTLFAGQTITFSFYAKRTSGTGALDVRFYYPSATDNFGTLTQIGSTVVVSASPSSSWTRYSVTAAIGTNVTTGLQILINNTGAATTFLTGAQLEIAASASSFSRNGSSISQELLNCQRYYFRASSDSGYKLLGNGTVTSVNNCDIAINLPVQMRTIPNSLETSAMSTFYYEPAGGSTPTTVSLSSAVTQNLGRVTVAKTSSFTVGYAIGLFSNNTAAYLGFSAEL